MLGCVGAHSLVRGHVNVKSPSFLYVCYFLFRTGVDRVTFPSKEHMRGQNVFLMAKYPKLFIRFLFLISISEDSASYFLEMIMLTDSVGNRAQTNIMVVKTTYPS